MAKVVTFDTVRLISVWFNEDLAGSPTLDVQYEISGNGESIQREVRVDLLPAEVTQIKNFLKAVRDRLKASEGL